MTTQKTYLVTGGCGFIGSHFVLQQVAAGHRVINLDALTYAAQPHYLAPVAENPLYHFVHDDIRHQDRVLQVMTDHKIDAVVHFAAESHVDNSINGPQVFIETNVLGTYHLLMAALRYWTMQGKRGGFRFVHVSTDEVFGQLPLNSPDKFPESTPYQPSSPYSASKAGSDMLAKAWHHTYGLPVIVTNCSNNFGPHQHAEKLIPTMIRCALAGKPLPVYGQGLNVRDWIYVGDHCRGVALALAKGRVGESYCFGGRAEWANIDLVRAICQHLDAKKPRNDGQSYATQISFVTDRLGHDLRYAINDSKAERELDYQPEYAFDTRLAQTIDWYINHFTTTQKAAE